MSPTEWMDEVRKSARRIARTPGFALLVMLTLALGVGANTAIFTVLDAVLLKDLPYPEPERLVRVYEGGADEPTPWGYNRAPMVVEYRGWDEIFDEVGSLYTYREVGADLTGGDQPERVTVVRASAGYFETLGIAPRLGRTFTEEESYGPGENVSSTLPMANVAVVSHGLWTTRLGGGADVLGSTLHLDGTAFEVVGVMPAGFNNPFGTNADVWVPLDMRPGGSNSFGNFYLSTVARLRPGITVESAQERARVLGASLAETNSEIYGSRPYLIPLKADIVGDTRTTMLWILAAAAGLVLLTACMNVANLLFARGLGRDRDLALRSALGSGRGRLVVGILTENGLLALGGGLLGLVLGWGGLTALLRLAPDALPMAAHVEMGGTVFFFALAVTSAALLVLGLAPALRMSRTQPADVLRSGDRASTGGRAVRRLRDGMVIVQMAAALVLVAGSMLLARSFGKLLDVPLGVDPVGVFTFEVHLPGSRYEDGPARQRFHERLQARVADLPGVEAVGAVSWLPVNGPYHTWGFNLVTEDPDDEAGQAFHSTDVRIFTGDYFDVMGIDVLRGQSPSEVDLEGEPVAWVNARVADEVFPDVDAVGQQIRLADGIRRIVGVVEDIPEDARGGFAPKSYVPHEQYSDNRNWALIQTVKSRGDLADLRERIRAELRAVDPQLVLYRPQSFEAVLDGVRAQDRFATVLMGAFAVLALLLSLVGTYGVLAGTVAGRRREIGIRMALGADTESVRGIVLRYAASLTVPGVALGLLVALFGSRLLDALLFGVESGDPATYGFAVAVFLGVGLAAGWLPARRAMSVDPARTLAEE